MAQPEQLQLFYGYWQISVCLFAGIALLAIWHHITNGKSLLERDPGLLWLAIAVLVWGFSGWVEVVQAQTTSPSSTANLKFEGWKGMLSIFNSTFILLALPRFRHIPPLIRPIIQSGSWRVLVGISFAFASTLTLLMLAGWIVPVKTNFIYTIDLAYAVFTLFFLGLVLWMSFEKRGLRLLAYLSILSIAFTFLAQVLKLTETPFYTILLNGVFKSILITIFFALALSWVEELSNLSASGSAEEGLVFFNKHKNANKWVHEVFLHLPPFLAAQRIQLTEKNYSLLYAFAERRAAANTEGWLEIQPKSSTGKAYDIKDYNQINRLLTSILQQIPNHDEKHKEWLKNNLFEYGKQRHLRLRIRSENLRLS